MYYNMRAPEGELTTLKAGTGAMQTRTDIDFSAASAQPTGKPLDYAIMAEGFFMLQDPATGEITYTRDGHFQASVRADGNTKYLFSLDSQTLFLSRHEAFCIPIAVH